MDVERKVIEEDRRISEVIERERPRLRSFVRRRVPDPRDVEDVLQDVFWRLVEANRLLMPIDSITGWLFQVARNRIADSFRERREAVREDLESIADLVPSADAGPEALHARAALHAEIERALDALPPEQREAFVAHELEGKSFKVMSEETGVGVNTLLSRKRYAVLHLRHRLQRARDAFGKGRRRKG